jgi:hypothetical protein
MRDMKMDVQTINWRPTGAGQVIREWDLQISIADVIRMQAADPQELSKRNPVLIRTAEGALENGTPYLEPVVLFRTLKVERLRHQRFFLEGGFELQSELLSQHLKGADYITVALCSIGAGVEQLARDQFGQDPVYGLAVDAFGSAAVETLATEFCAWIDEQVAPIGMASSVPVSPGMLGWPVESGQQQIFRMLDSSVIDVQLSDSFMMQPVKTISLVVGIGEQINVSGSSCDYCSMRERCHYRGHYLEPESS